jgi:hypothetical protein
VFLAPLFLDPNAVFFPPPNNPLDASPPVASKRVDASFSFVALATACGALALVRAETRAPPTRRVAAGALRASRRPRPPLPRANRRVSNAGAGSA